MTIITRRGTALLAAGFAALPTLSRRALAAPQVGQAAPDFAEPDQDGTVRRLSDLRGKIVVLEWTNHECPFVRKHYGSTNMQTLQRQAAEQGVVWLSIASSPAVHDCCVSVGSPATTAVASESFSKAKRSPPQS